MFNKADDYRRHAEKLANLAAETPNECLRKSFTSIAANWRAVAATMQDEPPSLAKGPLIDGKPGYHPIRGQAVPAKTSKFHSGFAFDFALRTPK